MSLNTTSDILFSKLCLIILLYKNMHKLEKIFVCSIIYWLFLFFFLIFFCRFSSSHCSAANQAVTRDIELCTCTFVSRTCTDLPSCSPGTMQTVGIQLRPLQVTLLFLVPRPHTNDNFKVFQHPRLTSWFTASRTRHSRLVFLLL